MGDFESKKRRSVPASESLELRRLVMLQLAIACSFAVVAGSLSTIQFCFGLAKFGGLEYAPRVTVLSSVREVGPAVSASATLLALLVCTRRWDAEVIRASLLRAAVWVILVAVAGVPPTTIVALASGFFVAHFGYGVPWAAIEASRSAVTWADSFGTLQTFAWCVSVDALFCWFALPAMSRRSWSLAQRVGATWASAVAVRLLVAGAEFALEPLR